MNNSFALIAGSSHPELAEKLSNELNVPLGNRTLTQFPDGELSATIHEDVCNKKVFILQSIAHDPNRYLVETLLMIDALKRASASQIIPVIPYFGYSRGDRQTKLGAPISAKLAANLLYTAGAYHIITCDLHTDQLEGFFPMPITHLHSHALFIDHIQPALCQHTVIVAPDLGIAKSAKTRADLLGLPLAVIDKTRSSPTAVTGNLLGDVARRPVHIVDDNCTTAGTLISAAEICQKAGASRITASITHGLFTGDALYKLSKSPIQNIWVSDSVKSQPHSAQITTLSLAPLLAQAISKQID